MAMDLIYRLDHASDHRPLTRPEFELRKVLKRKLLGLCSLERSIARQRSRLLHLKEGDANTEFFHWHARQRQRRNLVTCIKKDGELVTGHDDIASVVDDYYDGLFGSAPRRGALLLMDQLGLPRRDLSHLERRFTEEEVEKVVKSMPQDKASGTDGFTNRFYACCWSIIKVDMMRAMDAFYHGDVRGMQAINKACVTLLPKVDGAEELRDYRSISLVHGAIKIFDKVLATRLADDLPYLVGKHQSAFVRGRYLHDNFMLVQGTTRRLHALREPRVLLKLDISKAFDSVQWPFLLEVMHCMGFGRRWSS